MLTLLLDSQKALIFFSLNICKSHDESRHGEMNLFCLWFSLEGGLVEFSFSLVLGGGL